MEHRSSRAQREGLPRIEGFDALELIGQGAYASVYRAIERQTGRAVALKVLETAIEVGREAQETEMRALARLGSHPHIVNLYWIAHDRERRPVLVLELCQGSYEDRLRAEGRLGVLEVLRVGIKIADALAAAHELGLIHADVKPGNLLISTYQEPKLSDFGVALLGLDPERAPQVAHAFTTLHAAPEQIEGRPTTPATDVYGLASSLYELIEGVPPFPLRAGESRAAVARRIVAEEAPPLGRPGVPDSLRELLRACLSKRADARPGSARELARALASIAGGDPMWQEPVAEEPSRVLAADRAVREEAISPELAPAAEELEALRRTSVSGRRPPPAVAPPKPPRRRWRPFGRRGGA
jgi:serine/threonine protein kinase